MNVGSFLEIYTTMIGWSFYNMLYDLFKVTGILYLPFLMLLYRSWREPYLSQDDKPAAVTSQRRMTWGVISMVIVFSLAVLPFQPLALNEVRYKVACTDNTGAKALKQNVAGGNTNTTYDATLAGGGTRIPIFWWLALSISSGINYAATGSFKCVEDIKGLDQQLRNLTIKDPALREEYSRFARECFLPARSKYLRAMRGGEHHAYTTNAMANFLANNKEYDANDPYFIGSHFYIQTDGFYKDFDKTNSCQNQLGGCGFQAEESVPGWPYVQNRDNDTALKAANKGRPFCDEWWEDGVRGLEKKLLGSMQAAKITSTDWDKTKSFFTNVKNIIAAKYTGVVYTNDQIEDLIIQRYVSQDPPDMLGGWRDQGFFNPNTMTTGQIAEGVGIAGVGAVGIGLAAGPVSGMAAAAAASGTALQIANAFSGFYTTMFVIKTAAPMIQAVLLMMIYALLLIYLVVSEYDVDAVITALFLILAIRFFTPLWALADYLDSQLFVAMFPDATFLGSIFTMGIERLLLDMVLTTLYVVAPMLLLALMTMAGQRISSIGSSGGVSGLSNPVSNVGGKVGGGFSKR